MLHYLHKATANSKLVNMTSFYRHLLHKILHKEHEGCYTEIEYGFSCDPIAAVLPTAKVHLTNKVT